jgi:hypothetical protein
MLVRMTTGLSGPAFSLSRGDERDFPDGEAIRLINAGYAVPVEARQAEFTTLPPAAETRQKPEPFGGKGDHDGDGKAGGAKRGARKKAAG